jgi:hypothetical protein
MHVPALPYGSMNSLNTKADGRRIIMFGFGKEHFGFGLRRLLIFLLVIATIFVFAGVGFGY